MARRPPTTYAVLHRPPNLPGPGGWSVIEEAGSVAAARESAASPPVRLRHGDLLRVVSSVGADHGLWVFDVGSGAPVPPPRSSFRARGSRSWVDWWEGGDDVRHMAISWAWRFWGTGVGAPEASPDPADAPWAARRTAASCAACYLVARPLVGARLGALADVADDVSAQTGAWADGEPLPRRAFRDDLEALRGGLRAAGYDVSRPGEMLAGAALNAAAGHPFWGVDGLLGLPGARDARPAMAAAMRAAFPLSQILCACLGLADPLGGYGAARPHDREPR